jgi:hypothetical protein
VSHHSARTIVESRNGVSWLGRHRLRTLYEPELDAAPAALSFLGKRKPVWRHR